ncbi:MAG: hypothetical protein JW936_04630 [Sedimentisphaerales bacterium]|nr:hypothetical protein [Sedimentisphaerales bacterium]
MRLLPQKWLNRVAVLGLAVLTGRNLKASSQRLRKMNFSTDTGGMGVRFSERVRNVWRNRWLRIRR